MTTPFYLSPEQACSICHTQVFLYASITPKCTLAMPCLITVSSQNAFWILPSQANHFCSSFSCWPLDLPPLFSRRDVGTRVRSSVLSGGTDVVLPVGTERFVSNPLQWQTMLFIAAACLSHVRSVLMICFTRIFILGSCVGRVSVNQETWQ